MMTPERVTVDFVRVQLKEFYAHKRHEGAEIEDISDDIIVQSLIVDMNKEIDGGSHESKESATSYVPQVMWQVLADEDIVDEDDEDDFIEWFEAHNS